MDKIHKQAVLSCFDDVFDILFSLESIIKITKSACTDKEIYATYYNLSAKEQAILSEERNNYINMLTLALDKVTTLKDLNLEIEKELIQLQ